jgi:hypothetical protein
VRACASCHAGQQTAHAMQMNKPEIRLIQSPLILWFESCGSLALFILNLIEFFRFSPDHPRPNSGLAVSLAPDSIVAVYASAINGGEWLPNRN